MPDGKDPQLAGTIGGEPEELAPVVVGIDPRLDQTGRDGSLHELDRRVVLELESFGDVTDGRRSVAVPPANREQELVLVRREAGVTSGVLGEA